ncbi:MAG: hypothetical protein NTU94_12640, partial [Planctomycetota bacterium]|nr:hypothetical protein [Planctomycetota bacterium]
VNLRLDSTKLAEGRVPLNWDILEQSDGAIIQLIYAGDENTDINIEGVLEGQPSVSRLEYSRKLQRPENQFSSDRPSPSWVGMICCILGSGLILIDIIAYCRHGRRGLSDLFVITVMGLLVFAVGSYIVYRALTYSRPPFGF